MPDPVGFIIIPVLVPAAISLIVLLIAWRPWTGRHVGGEWGAPLAMAAGFVAMFRYIVGAWPSLPAAAADGWIFYAAILAGIVAVLDGLLRLPARVRIVPSGLVLLAAFLAVLKIPLGNEPTRMTAIAGIIGGTIGGIAWWLAFQRNSEPSDRVIGLWAAGLLVVFAAAILMMSGSTKYGRLALALAGATAPVVLMGLVIRHKSFNRAALVLTAVLGGLLVATGFFSSLSTYPGPLLLIALSPALLIITPWRRRVRRPVFVVVLSLSIFSTPLLVATAMAAVHFMQQMSADESEHY